MNLVFDLDGTLTDPQLGITRCFAHALERLGHSPPERGHLRRYIGPPLRDAFAELLATSDPVLIEEAVSAYRERFGEVGLYENELYPETEASLRALAASGHRLFVATAKAQTYAWRILEHFALAQYFVQVYGPALSGEGSHKSDLLARLVGEQRIDPGESVMIGDRGGDIDGARANSMRSIGVLWGYGTAEELAQADVVVRTWGALRLSLTGR
jgi:phosphoglycolate phosphatase